ncbi:hypothetical protein THAOC_11003 [Thalassiosira oceanica]|uniref:Peptidase M3A/M3B catalytic domain-containing protein n=1 Tax=Thalassiosira oceanica TaxID=159749 RepID=K0TBN4_THAOC|nr:hypothetical protein THAOC_11003 [Thalassiosira oceanica]|eukprot:EJK67897.1 hypothetical protein THAOC_11003 [Thalassiosira oceanica]
MIFRYLAVQVIAARAFRSSPVSTTAKGHAFRLNRLATSATATATALHSASTLADSTATGANSACVDEINPLLASWDGEPYNLPPFSKIKTTHFEPALHAAMEAHLSELEAIAASETNDFDSILKAYDRAGGLYSKVGSVYGNYLSSLNTPEMQDVQTAMAPVLSRHRSKTYAIPGLFSKIEMMYNMREEKVSSGEWDTEQSRLAERIYLNFVRQGAKLDSKSKDEYADIQAELAGLQTSFIQNMLKDEETWEMVLSENDMEGCPTDLVSAARQAALDRGHAGEDEYVITLGRSLVEPFLTYSSRRDLREKAFAAWTSRGELSEERDNLAIATQILKLRRRQAELMGYKTFAEFQLEDTMAQNPDAVKKLLLNVWERAKESAKRERSCLEEFVAESGETLDGGVMPFDWRYYAEKVRKANYDFDESELKPYLSLDSVTNAIFDVSGKLFGLKYRKVDVQAYHPDVTVYEVRKEEGGEDRLVSLFLADNYARQFKSSGAWMSEYRSQTKNIAPGTDEIEKIPIVSNNNNFAKGSGSTLLSFDGKRSGYPLDYLFQSDPDFVELPSQLMEHWFEEPRVLKEHARHHETGEPVPDELIERLKAASVFNEGFATVEYTACALYDMAVHSLSDYDNFDLAEFEKEYLQEIGMVQGIVMRHRPAHFAHLFASSSYAAGYYVYQWAQVLDNDVYAAFEETGDVFDTHTAEKCRQLIYSAGNTEAPEELFRQFRGRDPDISFFLKNRGLSG